MKCPECNYEDSKVIDSRPSDNNHKIRRRRECIKCSTRFTTYEHIEDIPVMVVKKDNTIEPFDTRKLTERVLRATIKRPVKLKTVENMVEGIHLGLKNTFQREIASARIGELVMQQLKRIDHVAYVRFASVYREFDDIDSFVKLISEMQSGEE